MQPMRLLHASSRFIAAVSWQCRIAAIVLPQRSKLCFLPSSFPSVSLSLQSKTFFFQARPTSPVPLHRSIITSMACASIENDVAWLLSTVGSASSKITLLPEESYSPSSAGDTCPKSGSNFIIPYGNPASGISDHWGSIDDYLWDTALSPCPGPASPWQFQSNPRSVQTSASACPVVPEWQTSPAETGSLKPPHDGGATGVCRSADSQTTHQPQQQVQLSPRGLTTIVGGRCIGIEKPTRIIPPCVFAFTTLYSHA